MMAYCGGMSDDLLSIDELAELGGVNRRTVRYYVQRGLLPPPLGVGRGSHWTRAHLEVLLRIKALQQEGASLEAVARLLDPAAGESLPVPAPLTWRRVEVVDGLEVHVRADLAVHLGALVAAVRSVLPPNPQAPRRS